EAIYRRAGIPVTFVGHPLVEIIEHHDPAAVRQRFGVPMEVPIVGVLPGSRPNEVERILPDLLRAVDRIRIQVPAVHVMIARAPGLEATLFDSVRDGRERVTVVEGETDAVLSASTVVLTASGTATVQTALHDVPMVIVYRVSNVTYWIGRRL